MSFETIVVGTDGSDNAWRAVGVAADLASIGSSPVHVVCAYQPMSGKEIEDVLEFLPKEFHEAYDPVARHRETMGRAERYLDQRHIDHKSHLVEGNAAVVILDVAQSVDADLIVVGSRGVGRATRFLRGSTSARISNHAECSFLVIQHD